MGLARLTPILRLKHSEIWCGKNLFSPEITIEKAHKNYIKSIHKALLKIIAKMGISTIQSYRGAQIFEAIGLNRRS